MENNEEAMCKVPLCMLFILLEVNVDAIQRKTYETKCTYKHNYEA